MLYRALAIGLTSLLALASGSPVVAQVTSAKPAATTATPARPAQQAPAAAARTPAPSMPKATFLANVDKEFDAMDANKDKKLTKAEIEQFRTRAIANNRLQRNRALFMQLDTDKNGYLSPQEFEKIAGPMPTVNVQPLMDKIDSNRDQQVTQAEYRAGAIADFDRLDTNKDGVLSPAEARGGRPAPR